MRAKNMHSDHMIINQAKVVVKMAREEKSELDKFVEQLQNEIDNEARKIYTEKVLEEFKHPYHFGKMENASISGKIKGSCGDTMQLFLKIKDNQIIDSSFFTDGCGATVACGSMISKLIQKKSIDKVAKITDEDLKNALDGLPPENEHCAELAINTLKSALENYQKNKSNRK